MEVTDRTPKKGHHQASNETLEITNDKTQKIFNYET